MRYADEQAIRAAIIKALDQDDGVNEAAYEALLQIGELLSDTCNPIFERVDYTDGGYYLTEEAADDLRDHYGLKSESKITIVSVTTG